MADYLTTPGPYGQSSLVLQWTSLTQDRRKKEEEKKLPFCCFSVVQLNIQHIFENPCITELGLYVVS